MVTINAADPRTVPGLRIIALAVMDTDSPFAMSLLVGLRSLHPEVMAELEEPETVDPSGPEPDVILDLGKSELS